MPYLDFEPFCLQCGKELYHPAHSTAHKYCSKKCKRRAYYLSHREQEIQAATDRRLADPECHAAANRKWRRKKKIG